MAASKLTYASAVILWTLHQGNSYGFQIMEATGLPSGTVYPALRRLEAGGFIACRWNHEDAETSGGPARKCYQLTAEGRKRLRMLTERFPLLAKVDA